MARRVIYELVHLPKLVSYEIEVGLATAVIVHFDEIYTNTNYIPTDAKFCFVPVPSRNFIPKLRFSTSSPRAL